MENPAHQYLGRSGNVEQAELSVNCNLARFLDPAYDSASRFTRSVEHHHERADVVPQKQKRPQQDERSLSADVGGRAVNIIGPVRQALQAQGLVLPTPFGRVEGGVYLQNEDLARAQRFARSLPGQATARRESTIGQALEKGGPSNSLEQIRHWYAEELRYAARVSSPAVIGAFATVPRERFVGPGPWRIRSPMNMDEYWSTEDANPRHVYHDVLIALDEARGINNGQPSLWARLFDHLDIKAGEQVLHLGCGTGYYSAIAAELVGPAGQISAIEIDATLAEKARAALAPWPQVSVSNADGAHTSFDPADVVIASAGATHPLLSWLNTLKPGGRLLFPMTTAENLGDAELSMARIALSAGGGPGGMLLVVRRAEHEFSARFLCRAGFIHFQGARDQDADRRLAAALARDWGAAVKSLLRDSHLENETCWLHGEGWCLSRRPLLGQAATP
jgi:protein-L-isoaspartate(D-aspartate) O-methyltransferase